MKLFGWEIRKAAASRRRGVRPAQSRGRPAWFTGLRYGMNGPVIAPEKDLTVYDEMRRMYPVLDAAVKRTVRLVGQVSVAGSKTVEADLNEWLPRVQVNQTERGFHAWMQAHLDAMLVFGKGVGEIVPTRRAREVYALTNLDPLTIDLVSGEDPLSLRIYQRQSGPHYRVELDPALTVLSVNLTRGRDPNGSSMFRSLSFVAKALSIVQNATSQTWERQGAPSYHVNWQPEEGFSDPDGTIAAGFVDEIATEFQNAMESRTTGEIRDFFSSGKVTIDSIGAEAQLMAIQEPFRAFTEQMVAVTDLPSWLLGLHWSSTERLSSQQADMILSYLEDLRRNLTPAIETILELRQRMVGRSARFQLKWSEVTLRDLTETARGEAWTEQAHQRRIENGRRMWEQGYWTQLQAAQHADPQVEVVVTEHETPPGEPLHSGGALTPGSNE